MSGGLLDGRVRTLPALYWSIVARARLTGGLPRWSDVDDTDLPVLRVRVQQRFAMALAAFQAKIIHPELTARGRQVLMDGYLGAHRVDAQLVERAVARCTGGQGPRPRGLSAGHRDRLVAALCADERNMMDVSGIDARCADAIVQVGLFGQVWYA